jgi:Xaa-Pro aminopeptidase
VLEIAEDERAVALLEAQDLARVLFAAIDERSLVRPGVTERQLSGEIGALASELLGVERHWHKRVVRAGANSMLPFHAKPQERTIGEDDIVYLDLGPIFEAWEADFGRTYVLGDDPAKLALRDTLPVLFAAGRAHFDRSRDITGAQLWDFMIGQAADRGYEWGGTIAGHIVGEFPHEGRDGDADQSRICPANHQPLRGTDRAGRVAHWILEVHIVDRERQIGGFYEELLDL